MIRFTCPNCQKTYAFRPAYAGRSGTCVCGARFTVPGDAPALITVLPAPSAETPSPIAAKGPPALPSAGPESSRRGPRWLIWLAVGAPVAVIVVVVLALMAYRALQSNAVAGNAPDRLNASGSTRNGPDAELIQALKCADFSVAAGARGVRGVTEEYSYEHDYYFTNGAVLRIGNQNADASQTAQAMAWLQRAADDGDSLAMNNMAVCYALGKNVPADAGKALALFEHAARLGSKQAWDSLLFLYPRSNRVPTMPPGPFASDDLRHAEVRKLFQAWEKQADAGDVIALVYVAKQYESGRVPGERPGFYTPADSVGTPAELQHAATLYQRASKAGYPDAQAALGSLLLRTRDPKARLYGFGELLRAARSGHRGAISLFCENAGSLAPADRASVEAAAGRPSATAVKPAEWCYRAAMRRDTAAPLELAGIYAVGLDVPPDPILARAWLKVAGSGVLEKDETSLLGGEGYRKLDVTVRLADAELPTPEATAKSDQLAAELLKKIYP